MILDINDLKLFKRECKSTHKNLKLSKRIKILRLKTQFLYSIKS
jgi:hypothetical protein